MFSSALALTLAALASSPVQEPQDEQLAALQRQLTELNAESAQLKDRIEQLAGRMAELQSPDAPAQDELERRRASAAQRCREQRKSLERAEEKLLEAMHKAGVVDPDPLIQEFAQTRRQWEANVRGAEQDLEAYQARLGLLITEHAQLPDHVGGDAAGLVPNGAKLELAKRIESLRARMEDKRETLASRIASAAASEQRQGQLIGARLRFTRLQRDIDEAEQRYQRSLTALLDAEDALNRR